MELFGGVLGALLIAILLSVIFYYAFNIRGPWGSFWTFFLVLLLTIWAASLWVDPVGPIFWGIAWIPLFFVGLLFALLLAAIPTDYDRPPNKLDNRTSGIRGRKEPSPEDIAESREASRTAAAVSGLFWIFLLILLIVVIAGYSI